MSEKQLTIDVVSDVVCPWCFLGKRKLEKAIALYRERHPGEAGPVVRWLPFQLNPDLPDSGIPRAEYVARKFGPGHKGVNERVVAIGREFGIGFDYEKMKVQPNTLNAHRLMLFAEQAGRQGELAEELFRAHFIEGANLTEAGTLADIAARAGLPREAAAAFIASDEGRDIVARADAEARNAGIGGVPFFIFNRRTGVSGAQDPEILLQAMEQALKSE